MAEGCMYVEPGWRYAELRCCVSCESASSLDCSLGAGCVGGWECLTRRGSRSAGLLSSRPTEAQWAESLIACEAPWNARRRVRQVGEIFSRLSAEHRRSVGESGRKRPYFKWLISPIATARPKIAGHCIRTRTLYISPLKSPLHPSVYQLWRNVSTETWGHIRCPIALWSCATPFFSRWACLPSQK